MTEEKQKRHPPWRPVPVLSEGQSVGKRVVPKLLPPEVPLSRKHLRRRETHGAECENLAPGLGLKVGAQCGGRCLSSEPSGKLRQEDGEHKLNLGNLVRPCSKDKIK